MNVVDTINMSRNQTTTNLSTKKKNPKEHKSKRHKAKQQLIAAVKIKQNKSVGVEPRNFLDGKVNKLGSHQSTQIILL